MNRIALLLALAGLGLSLSTGCRRQEQKKVAERAEASLPPGEQKPESTAREAQASSSEEVAEETPKPEQPPRVDPALAEVPAELLASDGAYEVWFKKHGLDLTDPTMLDTDSDGDGSSNRDEFTADTNPRDPNSRPGIHRFMRLKSYTEVKLPLILESTDGDSARIKRTGEAEAKTETVRTGQTIDGMKVERVISRYDTDKNGQRVNISRVVLGDPASKEKVVLVKDMPARSAASSAILTSADGRTTLTVKQGETFSWPSEEGSTYKVLDLRAEQAVVQEVETGKMWTIPKP